MIKWFFAAMCGLCTTFSFAAAAQNMIQGAPLGFGLLAILAGIATLLCAACD